MICFRTHVDELLLLLVPQAVVASGQVVLQAGQRRHHHPLHLAAFRPRAWRREAQPADTTAGPDERRQHVLLIEHAAAELG